MIDINPMQNLDARVSVPGSKSYSHRILIASALSDGDCTITNLLHSEDTELTAGALERMGIGVKFEESRNRMTVSGAGGAFKPCADPVYLGNSGTSMRLLTALAALGTGQYVLTGTSRMSERPILDLLNALNSMGVSARSVHGNGCPPVEVVGGPVEGGRIELNCGVSSQYLSALLLIAPYTRNGLDITITEGPVSRPYIDMTVDVMNRLGVNVNRDGYKRFSVAGGGIYKAGTYNVEPDCSNAGYFWAAAAVTGGTVKVLGVDRNTRQGDLRLLSLLENMGCAVGYDEDGVRVVGGPLKAIKADMGDMPDMVPTLAVVAAFADGVTEIENVAHLKDKESDRLAATATELQKMGVSAECTDSGLVIAGGVPKGADIDTYDDHRIAMSFSVAGLVTPGVRIENETCVEKSFPEYWRVFESLGQK